MGVTELMDVIVYLCVNEHVDVNIQWMDEPCMCIFVMYIIYISFHGFFVFLIHLWRHFYKIRVSIGGTFGDANLETRLSRVFKGS